MEYEFENVKGFLAGTAVFKMEYEFENVKGFLAGTAVFKERNK